MSNLNQMELQNLRHIISSYNTTSQKLQEYANTTQDTQMKAFFEKSLMQGNEAREKLLSFLN